MTTVGERRRSSTILTINAGSSSVKWALFEIGAAPVRTASGTIQRIGLPDGLVTMTKAGGGDTISRAVSIPDHAAAVPLLMQQLEEAGGEGVIRAVGHRVVHGGERYADPERITPEVLEELRRLSPYDPEHLPAEIALIEAVAERYPTIPHAACFDTGFHRHLPRVATLLAIPLRYERQGVRRYGFHGLSYASVMTELARTAGETAARGRVIVAHLGNGASLAAVKDGRSIDTTMGFTPASGLPMSTRSGDLDPGLVSYLADTEGQTTAQFHEMVNRRSGLLGLSETSSDMRDLLAREAQDVRAAEAVALFCYQGKKWIGAYAAALGGLDQLVFSGGIGEYAAAIRARMCGGLEFLGLQLDAARNEANAAVISTPESRVTVRVIRTDEEVQIAQSVADLFARSTES